MIHSNSQIACPNKEPVHGLRGGRDAEGVTQIQGPFTAVVVWAGSRARWGDLWKAGLEIWPEVWGADALRGFPSRGDQHCMIHSDRWHSAGRGAQGTQPACSGQVGQVHSGRLSGGNASSKFEGEQELARTTVERGKGALRDVVDTEHGE